MGSRTTRMKERARRHEEGAARAMDGFVRTPTDLAVTMASRHPAIGCLHKGGTVLEPSAGDGALVREILDLDKSAHVIAVEPNGGRADALDALAADPDTEGRLTVHRSTFEDYAAAHPDPVDAVLMNPPFGTSNRDHVWCDHVRMAWELLHPGGQVLAVVPNSYAYHRMHEDLRAWVGQRGGWFDKLPADTFKASGTGVAAGLLTVPKAPQRPDGTPLWLYQPDPGVPVVVKDPQVATVTLPVQEYRDWWRGGRDRVLRFAGLCFGCSRPVWAHDGDSGAIDWECHELNAYEHGHDGPAVALCLTCSCNGDYRGGRWHSAAIEAVGPLWRELAPGEEVDDGPTVYPMDLCAGLWATVFGFPRDDRMQEWRFVTGQLTADPEEVETRGAGVVVKLRTASRVDIELRTGPHHRVEVWGTPAPARVPAVQSPTVQAPPPAEPASAPEGPGSWGELAEQLSLFL